jgi:hypothetical protein
VRQQIHSTPATAGQGFSSLERALGLDTHITLMKIQRYHFDDIHWQFWIGDTPVLTVGSETLVDADKLRRKWRQATGVFPYKLGSWREYSAWLAPLLARVEERFE